jgi:hypothetical protein
VEDPLYISTYSSRLQNFGDKVEARLCWAFSTNDISSNSIASRNAADEIFHWRNCIEDIHHTIVPSTVVHLQHNLNLHHSYATEILMEIKITWKWHVSSFWIFIRMDNVLEMRLSGSVPDCYLPLLLTFVRPSVNLHLYSFHDWHW